MVAPRVLGVLLLLHLAPGEQWAPHTLLPRRRARVEDREGWEGGMSGACPLGAHPDSLLTSSDLWVSFTVLINLGHPSSWVPLASPHSTLEMGGGCGGCSPPLHLRLCSLTVMAPGHGVRGWDKPFSTASEFLGKESGTLWRLRPDAACTALPPPPPTPFPSHTGSPFLTPQ